MLDASSMDEYKENIWRNLPLAEVSAYLEKQEVGKVFGIDRPQFRTFLIDEKHLLRVEMQRFV